MEMLHLVAKKLTGENERNVAFSNLNLYVTLAFEKTGFVTFVGWLSWGFNASISMPSK